MLDPCIFEKNPDIFQNKFRYFQNIIPKSTILPDFIVYKTMGFVV